MWSDYGSDGICVEYEVVDPSRLFPVFYEPSPIDFSKIIGYMAATAQVAYGEKMRQPFTKWTFITLYVFKS